MLLPPSLRYSTLPWRNWGEEVLLCMKIVPWEVLRTPELIHTAQTPNISKAGLGGMGSGSSVLVSQVVDKGLSPALSSSGWHCLLLHGSPAPEGTGHHKPSHCPMLGKSQCSVRDTKHRPSRMLYRSGMLSISTTAPEASFSWSYNPGHQIQYRFSQIKSESARPYLNWPNALMRTNQLQFSLLMLEVPGIYLFSCS